MTDVHLPIRFDTCMVGFKMFKSPFEVESLSKYEDDLTAQFIVTAFTRGQRFFNFDITTAAYLHKFRY